MAWDGRLPRQPTGAATGSRPREAAGASVVKLEDPPTPLKTQALLKLAPSLTVFGGLGGQYFLQELQRGARGSMTGFAFPEVLRAVRLAWDAGSRDDAGRLEWACADSGAREQPREQPGELSRQAARELNRRGRRRRHPFGWTTARTFRLGSTNQAAHEWPMSAIPSTVTGSGAWYSSIRTPRVRNSATAA